MQHARNVGSRFENEDLTLRENIAFICKCCNGKLITILRIEMQMLSNSDRPRTETLRYEPMTVGTSTHIAIQLWYNTFSNRDKCVLHVLCTPAVSGSITGRDIKKSYVAGYLRGPLRLVTTMSSCFNPGSNDQFRVSLP